MAARTSYSTSGYRGGRQSASVSSGGKIGRGGRYISRSQRYKDIRSAFGMSTG